MQAELHENSATFKLQRRGIINYDSINVEFVDVGKVDGAKDAKLRGVARFRHRLHWQFLLWFRA